MRTVQIKLLLLYQVVGLLLFSSLLFSQSSDSLFEASLDNILEERPIEFDSISNYLRSFRRDTAFMQQAANLFEKENYFEGASYVTNFLGSSYLHYSKYEEALEKFNIAMKYATRADQQVQRAIILNKIGVVYRRTNRIRSSLDHHQQARVLLNKIVPRSRTVNLNIAKSENSIGNCYTILNQHDLSIPHFESAFELEKSLNNKLGMAINYQNIGHANELLGYPNKAYDNYASSLALNEEIDSELGKIICTNSLARIKVVRNELNESAKMVKPLIPRIKDLRDNFHTALVLLNYGNIQTKLGNFEDARSHLEEALDLGLAHDLSFAVIESYERLSALEAAVGNHPAALTYLGLAKENNDKVVNDRNNQYINDLVFKYDSEKSKAQIQELSFENQSVKDRLKSNQIIFGSLFGGSLIFGGLLFAVFIQRQKRKDQEIINLKREHQIKTLESLIKGEEQERNRIAKDLHDGLNGDLSAIKFKLNKITESSNVNVSEVIDMIDRSCQQVRNISHNLIPPSLENFSLIEATDEFCSKMNESHEEHIHFQHYGDELQLDKKSEVNIYRIIQELITNSVKHAGASEISVQIVKRNSILQITVEDDGKGFKPSLSKSSGIGLKNIKSRVDYLGAELDFSSDNNGASYFIEIDTFNPHDN